MRTMPLLAISLLATGLGVAPASPAGAAGETCQGRAATIVGQPLQRVVGTEGPDVVVTNGAIGVDTLGGDDLVCVTDAIAPGMVTLRTGAGNDVVDASASGSWVDAELGAGSDHYTASAGHDTVLTGSREGSRHVDTEPDTVVATTGGNASQTGDEWTTGMSGVPNADVLQLAGVGHTVRWSGVQTAGSQVVMGTGATLQPSLGDGDIAIDAAGSWTEDGAPVLAWTGEATRFELIGRSSATSLSFTGTDRDEHVHSSFGKGVLDGPQRFDLGAGDDTLLSEDGVGGKGSSYIGGLGDDSIELFGGKRLDVEMNAGRMYYRQHGTKVGASFDYFEDVRVGARHLYVGGTAHADHVSFYACTATVRGRRGNDVLAFSRRSDDGHKIGCDARKSKIRIFGEDGKDTITGSRGRDLLVGGRGRDTVRGKANRDRCSGEKLSSCEVRVPMIVRPRKA
ncbi:hypothetical protein KDN32_21475 [Nocardioides sp. J2M5]|uniref:hypothetical protein n=1 Tax=Nocardioides palaemonis TaxID=2829810 RepID=UPI001BA7FBF9|nr:hypothetical protein [Nocardioides palaemonis]MBS2940315.1 hypothetical protein [Nocardioides palaemonis]